MSHFVSQISLDRLPATPQHRNTVIPKPTVPEANRDDAVTQYRHRLSAGVEHAGSIKKWVPRHPGGREVAAIGEDAEVGDEPHPWTSYDPCESERDSRAEKRSRPQRQEWPWIGIEHAVGQTPWSKLGVPECAATDPATNDVTSFVRESHHAPTGHQQTGEQQPPCCRGQRPRDMLGFPGCCQLRSGPYRRRIV